MIGDETMDKLFVILLNDTGDPQVAPGRIEYAAYPEGKLSTPDGSDHLCWDVAIGKDHTATIIMHKDAWEALKERTK